MTEQQERLLLKMTQRLLSSTPPLTSSPQPLPAPLPPPFTLILCTFAFPPSPLLFILGHMKCLLLYDQIDQAS